MCRLDALAALQVGDGAGHTQYAVVAAGRQAQALKGTLHELFAGGVQRTVLADHGGGHVSVAGHLRPRKALFLHLAGGVDPFPDGR